MNLGPKAWGGARVVVDAEGISDNDAEMLDTLLKRRQRTIGCYPCTIDVSCDITQLSLFTDESS